MASPYAELGVDRGASQEAIRAAFQARVRENHPDKGGTGDRVDAVARAYEVLRDPQRRRAHDAQAAKDDGVVDREVDLDDMAEADDGTFSAACRCGDAFRVSEEQLADGVDVVECGGCTLRIRVLYEVVEDGDD